VLAMEHELSYRALANNQIDVVNVYTTDADIAYYDLAVLQDDRKLFPRYEAVYIYRTTAAQQHPELLKALATLAGCLDEAGMIALNAKVKVNKQTEADVAQAFVRDRLTTRPARRSATQGGASGQASSGALVPRTTAPETSAGLIPKRFWTDTRNHLYLVLLPLSVDIVLAIPLGVLASRRPKLGVWLVGACGVLQTLPSLALLIFMVPFLGIGYPPALVALCVYGLLPILRNTYTGLCDIPTQLLEAADALGLPPRTRLWQIELPLASRTILAGIKTSAVINVGTATIGAIIGAGGYGEPIMMGVRHDDMHLLLQGAIPAACMAVTVQYGFEALERFVVPRGLRLRDEA
jgi:osmoprotectant transport system permease protein